MSIQAIWRELCSQKLRWAYDGKRDFYNSLEDEDVKSLFSSAEKGEVNVSVYGKSQVGKTTLILKLIGISEEHMQHVSSLLRGKRNAGNSATVTAMIYSMSEDDYFYYKEGAEDQIRLDDIGIEDKLAELRRRVEEDGWVEVEKVKVSIPRKYYGTVEGRLSINIIDLPGIDSSEPREHFHVHKIVNKFVPASNLVILIDRADQIANFRNIPLPGIDDWKDNPERFRIVLTRSVSNQSTVEDLKEMKEISKGNYVSVFGKDFMDNVEVELPERNMIFPLEYGESWERLDKNNKELKDRLSPIIEKLYEDLIEEIEASQNEYNLLMMNAKMYKSLQRIIQKGLSIFDEEIRNAEGEISLCRRKIEEAEGEIERKSGSRGEFSEYIGGLQGKYSKFKAERMEFYDWPGSGSGRKKVKGLLGFIGDYKDQIYRSAVDYLEEFNSLDRDFEMAVNIMKICNEKSEDTLSHLNGYIMDSYIRDSSWIRDREMAEETVNEMAAAVESRINSLCHSALKKKQAELDRVLENLEGEIAADFDYCSRSRRDLVLLEAELGKLRDDRRKYEELTSRDANRAEEYVKFIKEAFFREYRAFLRKVDYSNTPAEVRILYMDYLWLISKEMSKLEEQIL